MLNFISVILVILNFLRKTVCKMIVISEAPSQTNYNQFCSFPSNDFLGNTSKLGMQFQAQQYFNQQFPNYPHTQQMYMNMSHPFYNNNQQSNGCQYINNNEKVREDEADGGKSKRIRTLYTKFQTRVLEYYFAQNQYIGLPQRAAIAAQLQLSQTQVIIHNIAILRFH